MRKNGKNGLPLGSGLYWKRDVLYVEIWHGGKKLGQFSTRTADTNQALRFKDAKLAELLKAEQTHIADLAKGVRVSELLQDYIANLERREADSGAYMMSRKYEKPSYKAATRINKHLVPAFGKLKPEGVTTDVLIAYKNNRTRQHGKVPTINSEFRILRAALRRGTKTTPKKVNPLHIPDFSEVINDKAEKKAARTSTISEEQYTAIMENGSEHLKPVFVTCIYTGVRAKEIKFVRRDQVDFDANMIQLRAGETKDGDARIVPMNDRVRAVLLAWEEKTKQDFPKTRWFFHQNGEQLGSWKTAWNATLRRAGLRVLVLDKDGKEKVTAKGRKVWKNLVKFHDTRRTNITQMDELGLQEKDMMKVSGHKTVAMSRRYNQSKKAAESVRIAQNAALGKEASAPAAVAPSPSNGDWKASLKDLKETFEAGLLPEDLYRAEVSKVLESR